MWWMLVASARPLFEADPESHRCDEPKLAAALEATTDEGFVEGLIEACTLPRPLHTALMDHSAARPSKLAPQVCPRARADFPRALSPAFAARMEGVARSCKEKNWPLDGVGGPHALAMGIAVQQWLEALGSAHAQAAGERMSRVSPPGTYGAVASEADSVVLPTFPGSAVGDGPTWTLGGEESLPGSGPGQLIVLTTERTDEYAPVGAVRFAAMDRAAPVRIAISPTSAVLTLGEAGDQIPLDEVDLDEVRLLLIRAHEHGRENLEDRLWVQPLEGATVSRVLLVLEGFVADDGHPILGEFALGETGDLARWPEMIDASGL